MAHAMCHRGREIRVQALHQNLGRKNLTKTVPLPELARQLRQAVPCRPACWNFDYRGNRKISRQSANEQVAADALVPKRCRSPASGSLRGLQWNARLGIGPPVSAAYQPERAVGQRGMIPHSLDTPCPNRARVRTSLPRRLCGARWRHRQYSCGWNVKEKGADDCRD